MSNNPYESPRNHNVDKSPANEARLTALRSIRIALLILLVPAIYNFMCFNFPHYFGRTEISVYFVFRVLNFIGLALIALAVWFFGLAALEFVARMIHFIAARKSSLDDWKETLYILLRRAPWLAVPGAILWTIWVLAFYQLQFSFYTVAIPIGVAAHILAACLYLPLIYRWYKLERDTTQQIST